MQGCRCSWSRSSRGNEAVSRITGRKPGVSIYMIARFLGHADAKTAQRYAHLDTPLRQVQRQAAVLPLKKVISSGGLGRWIYLKSLPLKSE